MNDLSQILTAFEETLSLERELGTRTVECDRALLTPMRPPARTSDVGLGTLDFRSREPSLQSPIAFIVDAVPVGAAAELLGKMIAAMGYAQGEVSIAEATFAAQTPPNARVYVVLGSDARKLFMPQLRAARGTWTEVNGVPTLVTNSPARMLRFFANDPVRLREAKQQVWTDLKSAMFRLGRPVKR